MPQIENHMKWCLSDKNRLIKTKSNLELAQKHLKKSEYNYNIVKSLERMKIYDWALSIGFYSIYHCFLAILSKYGYQSRNQSCTISAILTLIDEKKIELDKDLVLQFDTIDAEKSAMSPTIRRDRELATYGVETSIDLKELQRVKEMIVKVQRETIGILGK